MVFTSRDVAERAGVSQSTVSYVMSGKRPISQKTRQRVQAVIDELTYQPNAGARALASQRTQVIALMAPFGPSPDASGMLPFLETIAGRARERDHDVLLVTASEGPSALTRLAGRKQCDAIVVMDIKTHDERVGVASALSVPIVLIGVPADTQGLPCVDLDFTLAGQMAATELARIGHRHIVLLGYQPYVMVRDLNYAARFDQGVTAAADELGLRLDRLGREGLSQSDLPQVLDQAVKLTGEDNLALIVPDPDLVQPILRALEERRLVLGDTCSVIALCTDAAAQAMAPPVTNVSQEPRDVSRRAMDLLFDLLDRGPVRAERGIQLVAPHLTRRSTTPQPAAAARA